MKKLISFSNLFFVVILFIFHSVGAQTNSSLLISNSDFVAEYDRLLDYYTHDINVGQVALSSDGNRIFFSGKNSNSDLVLRFINSDGTNLQTVSVPSGVTDVDDVAINQNGSVAFFLHSNNDYIYRVEGISATQILHRTEFSGIGNIEKIETTASGDYVYFNDSGEIYRISRSGGTPELIIDDEAVQRIEGTGRGMGEFAISSNGGTIAFVLKGYKDSENHSHTKYEVFAYKNGNIRQLTNDSENVYKEHLDISGDGSTIVYSAGSDVYKYYSIKTDGTNKIALDDLHGNFAALDLTYNGESVLIKDGGSRGGRIVTSDGSGGMDIFPGGTISIYDNGYFSSDGSLICFRYLIRSFPSRYALYVGHLYQTGVVSDAPTIENITFSPTAMPTNDPDAKIYVYSTISDPDGLDDIEEVTIDELIGGMLLPNDKAEVPVYFYAHPNDDGSGFDQTANDGIFTSVGEPGDKLHQYNQMTVRIGATDKSSTLVVRDVVLKIGGTTGLEIDRNVATNFKLYQNYPNPFNPSTMINYSLSQNMKAQKVELAIFNVLGEKIKTLTDKELQPGEYAVQWDGRTNSGNLVPSGLYLYQIRVKNVREIKKMMLVR